ncbi:MAG: heterodisulfide reductase-related iron-sulfur binding cluster [bacterium]
MKKILYYPGCVESNNLKTQNKNLYKIFELFDVEADFLEEWNCCGAAPGYYDHKFFNKVVMPLRNLGLAQSKGAKYLYTGCQVCSKSINKALDAVNKNSMYKNQIDYSLEPFKATLSDTDQNKTGAKHILDLIFSSHEINDSDNNNYAAENKTAANFLKKTVRNLKDHSILLYIGCYDNKENIEQLTKLLEDLGARVSLYSECCGGEKHQNVTPVRNKRIESANNLSEFFKSINKKANETNSDYILTICSMCRQNLINAVEVSDLESFAPMVGFEEIIGYLAGLDIELGEFANYAFDLYSEAVI